jgi:hypothetical protein
VVVAAVEVVEEVVEVVMKALEEEAAHLLLQMI